MICSLLLKAGRETVSHVFVHVYFIKWKNYPTRYFLDQVWYVEMTTGAKISWNTYVIMLTDYQTVQSYIVYIGDPPNLSSPFLSALENLSYSSLGTQAALFNEVSMQCIYYVSCLVKLSYWCLASQTCVYDQVQKNTEQYKIIGHHLMQNVTFFTFTLSVYWSCHVILMVGDDDVECERGL